jgi:acetyl esterase/lipase
MPPGLRGIALSYPPGRSRTARYAALILAALIIAVLFWHPARVATQALVLLPALFPNAPVDPLGLVTEQPTRTEHMYSYAAGDVQADIYHPSDHDPHGAVILLLGAGDLPRSDVAVHFAQALARLGVVVMMPNTRGMLEEKLTFDEVDALRASLNVLREQPDVDPARIGFVGLSASGGLSIVAAAQPDLRDEVRFVNSFGSYFDATQLLLDVASRSIDVDGQVRPWQPEQRTHDVVAIALRSGPPSEAAEELIAGTTRERAQALIAQLPEATRARLNEISPSTYLSQLKAHLYLMHDVDDPFIPFTQSRALAAAAPAGTLSRYTEFSIFAHVIPERAVPLQTFVPDVWRLFWHVQSVLMEVL